MAKIITLVFTLIISSISFAEHDATYCGRLIPGEQGISYGDHPVAIIVVGFKELVSVWPDRYEDIDGYAAIYATNNATAEKNLKKFLETAKPTTRICAKGRWGGGLYSSRDINDITLISDSIDRIDYASKLEVE
jgi:hypothetical protein